MSSTAPAEHATAARRDVLGLLLAALTTSTASAGAPTPARHRTMPEDTTNLDTLSDGQLAIGPIAARAAVGDITRLSTALDQGLDAGLTINEVKEVLVQLYAYAGFPRALNALAAFMKVLDERRGRDIRDVPGRDAGPVPSGQALLEAGTANQTRLSGAPVTGPLFDFAPAIDRFLKAHLFGDIFARDNLDWRSRELATVAVLSAMPGVEAQLQAHVRISMNVGVTAPQLRQFAAGLAARGEAEAGQRVEAALDKHLGEAAKP